MAAIQLAFVDAIGGMNSELISELPGLSELPLAFVLQSFSRAAPLVWFKRKGWF